MGKEVREQILRDYGGAGMAFNKDYSGIVIRRIDLLVSAIGRIYETLAAALRRDELQRQANIVAAEKLALQDNEMTRAKRLVDTRNKLKSKVADMRKAEAENVKKNLHAAERAIEEGNSLKDVKEEEA